MDIFPCLFQFPGAAYIAWLMVFSSIFKASNVASLLAFFRMFPSDHITESKLLLLVS